MTIIAISKMPTATITAMATVWGSAIGTTESHLTTWDTRIAFPARMRTSSPTGMTMGTTIDMVQAIDMMRTETIPLTMATLPIPTSRRLCGLRNNTGRRGRARRTTGPSITRITVPVSLNPVMLITEPSIILTMVRGRQNLAMKTTGPSTIPIMARDLNRRCKLVYGRTKEIGDDNFTILWLTLKGTPSTECGRQLNGLTLYDPVSGADCLSCFFWHPVARERGLD